jgi:hypothetical protein
VSLAHPISDRVVRQRQSTHRHNAIPVAGLDTATIIDCDRDSLTGVYLVLLKQVALLHRRRHGRTMVTLLQKTGQVWVRTP